MTANVRIPVASKENVVAVPLAAVFTEKNPDLPDTMERFVYIQNGSKFEKRNVKVGISDFFFAEVEEGLFVFREYLRAWARFDEWCESHGAKAA